METGVIYNEDCMETMARMEDNSVDLVLTDIPYGVVNRDDNGLRNLDKADADEFNIDIYELLEEMVRIVSGSLYVFCGTEQVSKLREEMVENGLSTRLIIWEKNNPSPMNGGHIWLSGVECCVYGKFSGATFNEHCKNTVLKYPCGSSKEHLTQKPLELFEKLIIISSNKNDIVYDPFIGSGTTAVACEKLDRKWIGSEISEKYCKLARERIKIERDQGKLF